MSLITKNEFTKSIDEFKGEKFYTITKNQNVICETYEEVDPLTIKVSLKQVKIEDSEYKNIPLNIKYKDDVVLKDISWLAIRDTYLPAEAVEQYIYVVNNEVQEAILKEGPVFPEILTIEPLKKGQTPYDIATQIFEYVMKMQLGIYEKTKRHVGNVLIVPMWLKMKLMFAKGYKAVAPQRICGMYKDADWYIDLDDSDKDPVTPISVYITPNNEFNDKIVLIDADDYELANPVAFSLKELKENKTENSDFDIVAAAKVTCPEKVLVGTVIKK